jgi:hypothetical protein
MSSKVTVRKTKQLKHYKSEQTGIITSKLSGQSNQEKKQKLTCNPNESFESFWWEQIATQLSSASSPQLS